MSASIISVVISTFNRNAQLKKCVESIINQTIKVSEIVVVHDGPSLKFDLFMQDTFPIEIQKGLISFHHTLIWSGRPAPARNYGLNISKGNLVAFCDDDDIWFPYKIQEQMKYMASIPNVDAVFSKYISFYNGLSLMDQPPLPIFYPTPRLTEIKLINFLDGSGLCLSSCLIRRSSIPIGGFDESKFVKAFEDYNLWLTMLINNKILINIDQELIFYLQNNPTSIRKNIIKHNFKLSITIFWTLFRNGYILHAFISPFLRLRHLYFKYVLKVN